MASGAIGFHSAYIASIHGLPYGKSWPMAITMGFCFFLLALMPDAASARQEKISVDSFRILGITPDFVDMELSGANDSSMKQLCLAVIAKSTDGIVRSSRLSPLVSTGDRQFTVRSRVMRPNGLRSLQTDFLMVTVESCGRGVVLRRKFKWPHAWPEKTAGAAGDEPDNVEPSTDHPWRVIAQNLDEEDYAAIDALVQKWNDPKERDQNGEWKLDSFRQLFVNYSSGNRDWKGDFERIKRWRAFNPKSVGAAIAEAKYWVAYAWHIRGNAYYAQTDPVALRVFGERMRRAEQVLKEAKDFAVDNPLWHEAYLDIAVATKRHDKFINALFNEAIHRHPYFQPLYLDMAKHWAPYSGDKADWYKVDDVIKHAVRNTAKMDGTGNYALLYMQISELQKNGFDLFQESQVPWLELRNSFEELVKRYPSAGNLNEFAAFACRANDKKTFLNIRPRIINHILPDRWAGNYSYDLCDHRFMQSI